MTARNPLRRNGDLELVELSASEITAVQSRARYLYAANRSVTLSRVSTSGTLGTLKDTRKQAGASTTDVTNFDTAAETPNITTKTVNYARISQSTTNTTATSDTNEKAYPVFWSGSAIQAMTRDDFRDTFIIPAIDTLTSASDQPGTYYIHTSATKSGYTAVSSSTIFSDTRADISDYTAGGIPESIDQAETIANYYLLRKNNIAAPAYEEMFYIDGDNNLREYSDAEMDALLEQEIRHCASEVTGTRIRYAYTGGTHSQAGVNLGSGMTDTRLNGSGNYQTRYVNTNDYRTQEFPNGTATTITTYRLRVYQV
jgi:hypothetical protein